MADNKTEKMSGSVWALVETIQQSSDSDWWFDFPQLMKAQGDYQNVRDKGSKTDNGQIDGIGSTANGGEIWLTTLWPRDLNIYLS